jgi:hypothetical protein
MSIFSKPPEVTKFSYYTNIAYAVVGIIILALQTTSPKFYEILLGLSYITLGVGSAYFHKHGKMEDVKPDWYAMYLVLSVQIFSFTNYLTAGTHIGLLLALNVILLISAILLQEKFMHWKNNLVGYIVIGVLYTLCIVLTIFIYLSNLYIPALSAVFFAIAFYFQRKGEVVRKDSALSVIERNALGNNYHSMWHILTALGFLLINLYILL